MKSHAVASECDEGFHRISHVHEWWDVQPLVVDVEQNAPHVTAMLGLAQISDDVRVALVAAAVDAHVIARFP